MQDSEARTGLVMLVTVLIFIAVFAIAFYLGAAWQGTQVRPQSADTAADAGAQDGTSNPGQGIAPFHSGVQGVVVLDDDPYATTVSVYRKGSDAIFASYDTGRDGTFMFSIPPGSYVVRGGSTTTPSTCISQSITVSPSAYENIQLACSVTK